MQERQLLPTLVLPDHRMIATQDVSIGGGIEGMVRVHYSDGVARLYPYTLRNVQLLRQRGFDAPSPIRYQYNWPIIQGRVPFDHQRKTAEFLSQNHRAFCFNQIGTGKTLSALWAADFLMSHHAVRKVLIVAPLSTLERVWGDEIYFNMMHRSFAVLHGSAAKRRKLLAQDVDFYIVNHDGLGVIYDDIWARDDIDLCIYDEATALRNNRSQRHKAFAQLIFAKRRMWVWLMTGSPTPNAPTDAFGLARLINPNGVPEYFKHFRNQVMIKVTKFKYVPRKDSPRIIKHVLQPSITFKRHDCIDMPPAVWSDRVAPLTPLQDKFYTIMLKHSRVLYKTGEITAKNAGVKMSKLLQIAGGVVLDTVGGTIQIDARHRLDAVKQVIEEADAKVIVFTPFVGILIEHLYDSVRSYTTAAMVHGGIPTSERNKIFSAFTGQDNPHVLVAHPQCMAHGLTLTSAATIIWYGPHMNAEHYEQANGRIMRAGQTREQNIIHLYSTNLERNAFKALRNKGNLQEVLIDELNALTENES